ncbi:hypothetical protein [Tautonia plasticadhaerens]|uniref:Uncharacterized protein n=1 Tax=Tautonia plasticadhaerens TaxID=2527974 RepID=A0A518GZN1_9BACT|nr:hypothetical protein [Tautonia plasticadhaerens]QDV34045.1 hypothetical protein ElP_19260 [Tautonia plasticadhaerens]
MHRTPSALPIGARRRWRKVGGVSHRFRRRRGGWESECGFYSAGRLRGSGPGRPGPATCSLCRGAGDRSGAIRAGELLLMHARVALREVGR